jgi:L-threonylcarbamoyladenylate synthase
VKDEFGAEATNRSGCILDGGQSQVGIESTILDLSRIDTVGPVLLRPGQISATHIADVIGIAPTTTDAAAPRVSGALASHYAPRTPVVLVSGDQLRDVLERLAAAGRRCALMRYSPAAPALLKHVAFDTMLPATPDGFAHALYAVLRQSDAANVDIIVIEAPPAGAEWQGVNDRLSRAVFGSSNALQHLL